MACIVLICRVEISSPTCHVYLSCALLFYSMYNTPGFSLYCEGCWRPLDLDANTFWEALQWEFEMMAINYSYPGIHQSRALNTFLSLKFPLQCCLSVRQHNRMGRKTGVCTDTHMLNYFDRHRTCQESSIRNTDAWLFRSANSFL